MGIFLNKLCNFNLLDISDGLAIQAAQIQVNLFESVVLFSRFQSLLQLRYPLLTTIYPGTFFMSSAFTCVCNVHSKRNVYRNGVY